MKMTGLYTAFADLATDDDEWFTILEDLLSAAEALEPRIKEYWEEEKRRRREESDSGTFLIFTYNPDPREIYFMLMAYALENACKAYLIKRGENAIWQHMAEKGELPKQVTGHDLTDLLVRTEFPLTEADRELAFRLERSAVWSARYPIPKKAKHKTVITSADKVPVWHNESDVETVKEFADRVFKHIVARLEQRSERKDVEIDTPTRAE